MDEKNKASDDISMISGNELADDELEKVSGGSVIKIIHGKCPYCGRMIFGDINNMNKHIVNVHPSHPQMKSRRDYE